MAHLAALQTPKLETKLGKNSLSKMEVSFSRIVCKLCREFPLTTPAMGLGSKILIAKSGKKSCTCNKCMCVLISCVVTSSICILSAGAAAHVFVVPPNYNVRGKPYLMCVLRELAATISAWSGYMPVPNLRHNPHPTEL